jgi:hypothetical protein
MIGVWVVRRGSAPRREDFAGGGQRVRARTAPVGLGRVGIGEPLSGFAGPLALRSLPTLLPISQQKSIRLSPQQAPAASTTADPTLTPNRTSNGPSVPSNATGAGFGHGAASGSTTFVALREFI